MYVSHPWDLNSWGFYSRFQSRRAVALSTTPDPLLAYMVYRCASNQLPIILLVCMSPRYSSPVKF